MKKFVVSFATLLLLLNMAFAGGILTNTNQSAQFARMMSRNASIDMDAVYFNPAGVMMMEDGLHFAFHNQSIFQKKTITSGNPLLLHDKEFIGDVKAPVFPSVFGVYKKDKLAISLGFGPNGGGGSADFAAGLPSFESQVAAAVPALASLTQLGFPVDNYGVDINFEGTSVFWGIQLGLSYKVSDAFSVYGGARYLPSKNTYAGSMTNIQLGPTDALESAATYLGKAATYATQTGATLTGTAAGLEQIILGGGGAMSIAIAQTMGVIDAATATQLTGGLMSIGLSQTDINAMNFTQIQQTFATTGATLTATGAAINAQSSQFSDKEVDTEQTGTGFTPIVGFNINLDKLNVGLKYEMETELVLENNTTVDDLGLFPDGQKSNSDLPAVLAVGADYLFTDNFKASLSYNLYFDKNVDWGNNIYGQKRTIDDNYFEIAVGFEFGITDDVKASFGVLHSNTGVSEDYQSDFSYSNNSYTGGVGFEWKMSDQLTLDVGFMYTNYVSAEKNFGSYNEEYDKRTFAGAIGIAYTIF